MNKDSQRRELSLIVPGESDYLQLIRDFVTAIARKVGFPDERVGEIEIAVDEACANIIEHAYGGPSVPGRVIVAQRAGMDLPAITLQVTVLQDRIEVKILDQGPNFCLESLRDLDLAEFVSSDRKRGIGTYIIRNFMDEVRHAYRPGQGNELVLVKYLASP